MIHADWDGVDDVFGQVREDTSGPVEGEPAGNRLSRNLLIREVDPPTKGALRPGGLGAGCGQVVLVEPERGCQYRDGLAHPVIDGAAKYSVDGLGRAQMRKVRVAKSDPVRVELVR